MADAKKVNIVLTQGKMISSFGNGGIEMYELDNHMYRFNTHTGTMRKVN